MAGPHSAPMSLLASAAAVSGSNWFKTPFLCFRRRFRLPAVMIRPWFAVVDRRPDAVA